MKLTVLGNNGPYPKAGGACSGYLLENNDTKILIDCGNGVLSRLQKVTSIEKIDTIILSHLHSDHISDILVMKYLIGIKNMREDSKLTIPLYAPNDDEDMVNRFNYNDSFAINTLDEELKLNIGGFEIDFLQTKHPVKSFAMRFKYNKKVFVYSADTSYIEELVDFAKGADLFLCEAGVLEEDRGEETPHLSAKEAGEIATKAGVKRLIITHFWPEYNIERIRKEAQETYSVILEMSEQMRTYYI